MNTQTKITEIVKRFASRPVDPSPEESLFDSGLLDSFALADMVSELEKEFSIKIPDSDLVPRKFDSISRIEAYVKAHS
jgi:acyl carrier protein